MRNRNNRPVMVSSDMPKKKNPRSARAKTQKIASVSRMHASSLAWPADPERLAGVCASNVRPENLARFPYVAYGSNLHIEQMMFRCPNARALNAARLEDHALVFRSVADVVHAPGEVTEIGLWSVTPDCIAQLDRYEGFPYLYVRRFVFVKLASGVKRCAFMYVMRRGAVRPPEPGYLQTILNGYHSFSLPVMSLIRAVKRAEEDQLIGRIYEHRNKE